MLIGIGIDLAFESMLSCWSRLIDLEISQRLKNLLSPFGIGVKIRQLLVLLLIQEGPFLVLVLNPISTWFIVRIQHVWS